MRRAKALLAVFGSALLVVAITNWVEPKTIRAATTTAEPVSVVNTPRNSVPVKFIPEATFTVSGSCQFDGETCLAAGLLTVPAGRTALIESLSVNCNYLTDQIGIWNAFLDWGNLQVYVQFPTPVQQSSGYFATTANLNTRTYVTGPASVYFDAEATFVQESGGCNGTISGYTFPSS